MTVADELEKLLEECGDDPRTRAIVLAAQTKAHYQATLEHIADLLQSILDLLREKEHKGRQLENSEERLRRLVGEIASHYGIRIDTGGGSYVEGDVTTEEFTGRDEG
jgi:hypothetical protein